MTTTGIAASAELTADQAAHLAMLRDELGGTCMMSNDQPGLRMKTLINLVEHGYLTSGEEHHDKDLILSMDGLNALIEHEQRARRPRVVPARTVDWESVAIRLDRAANSESRHLLSTYERDMLETAIDAAQAAERETD